MKRIASKIAGLAALLAAGCASQVNNVFIDPGVSARSEMTTASAEGYRHARPAPQDHRGWPESRLQYHHTEVTHWPVWWEDPFVDKGNDATDPNDRDRPDQKFAVNGADFLAIAYSPARCILNTVAWPISAIVTPPGTVMASDGRIDKGLLGYDHDARRVPLTTESPDRIRHNERDYITTSSAASTQP